MMIAETGAGHIRSAARWAARLPRDVAVHPFHRIGCRERQTAGQHFVKRDAERIQIAAGIDRRFIRPVCSGAM